MDIFILRVIAICIKKMARSRVKSIKENMVKVAALIPKAQ
jgi:hypothetical protein